jgi:hypothetical protein
MSAPSTLVELYAEAKQDVGEELATWAFRLAKARGRVVQATEALQHLRTCERDAHVAAFGVAHNESMKMAVLAMEPHPSALGNAVDALTEATEWCCACETVLRLLEARRPVLASVAKLAAGGAR